MAQGQSRREPFFHGRFPWSAIFNGMRNSKMSLAEKIQKDLVDAMRAKEELRAQRSCGESRRPSSTKKSKRFDHSTKPKPFQILQMLVKQRKESIDQFAQRQPTRTRRPRGNEKSSPSSKSYLPGRRQRRPKWTRPIAQKQSPEYPARLRSKQMGNRLLKAALRRLWKARPLTGKLLSDRVREPSLENELRILNTLILAWLSRKPSRYASRKRTRGYVTVRPVVKQSFRLAELADMVVSVTGKNGPRVTANFPRPVQWFTNGYR